MLVTVIDDLSTGRLENLASVAGSPGLRTHWASILEDEGLQELVDECDVVYHLAAAVGVRLILERPVETIETNILGTDRILRAAAKGHKTVVIASTSEVYGKNDQVPLKEDDDGIFGPTTKSRTSSSAPLSPCPAIPGRWGRSSTSAPAARSPSTSSQPG